MMCKLVLYIKVYRKNFFITISDLTGGILWKKTAGSLGKKNIQKRTLDVFNSLLQDTMERINKTRPKRLLFIKIEVPNQKILRVIYKKILFEMHKSRQTKFAGFFIINKIAHNGCRKKRHVTK